MGNLNALDNGDRELKQQGATGDGDNFRRAQSVLF